MPEQVKAEQQLLDHLLRREVVVFAGAGVSGDADPPLPDWKGLIGQLAARLPNYKPDFHDSPDALDLAQWYVEAQGRTSLETLLADQFGGLDRRPSPMQTALAALPVNLIFTTNYDQLIERALQIAWHELPDTIVDDRHVALINELAGTTVVKMHGCASLPDTIVLAREDYEQYDDRHRAIVTYLQSQLATRTFLFVGFSFTDPNFRVIHEAIQRTLGRYQRRAYALHHRPANPFLKQHWQRRGVDFIEFCSSQEQTQFVERLGQRANQQLTRGTSLTEVLLTLGERQPPPMFQAAVQIKASLDDIHRQVSVLLGEAGANSGLQLAPELPDADEDAQEEQAGRLEKVRALFGLAQGLEQMGYRLDPELWVRLGNAFYRHREWPLAIRAYTTAFRYGEGRARRTEGNLARAYLALGQYHRAEAVLRRLVFTSERGSDTLRLDLDWLRQRPHDLSELAYSVNRLAERLRQDGRRGRALQVLKELRPWLKDGLDALGPGQVAGRDPSAHRRDREGGHTWGDRAYLLNHLGKNYRLAYEISLERGDREEARRCRRKAIDHFVKAIDEAPTLVYPWSHLLDMYEQNLLGRSTAASNLRLNVGKIDGLPVLYGAAGQRARNSIKARHEATWKRYGQPAGT